MRCLMSLNQREAILAAIPPTGRMLEWGSGGTTLWLLNAMKPAQSLMSIEHHPQWVAEMRRAIGNRPNWESVERKCGLEEGKNATQWEECPAGLEHYINPCSLDFDVYLVDGIARGACLMNLFLNARKPATVFLHDIQRMEWYAWALRAGRNASLFQSETIIEPTAGDYPSKMLEIVLK